MKDKGSRENFLKAHPNAVIFPIVVFCLLLGYAFGRFGFKHFPFPFAAAAVITIICDNVFQVFVCLSELKFSFRLNISEKEQK